MFVLHISSLDISSWQSNAPVNSWYQTQETRGKTVLGSWVGQCLTNWRTLSTTGEDEDDSAMVEACWNGLKWDICWRRTPGEHQENTMEKLSIAWSRLSPLPITAGPRCIAMSRHQLFQRLPRPPSKVRPDVAFGEWFQSKCGNPSEIHEQFLVDEQTLTSLINMLRGFPNSQDELVCSVHSLGMSHGFDSAQLVWRPPANFGGQKANCKRLTLGNQLEIGKLRWIIIWPCVRYPTLNTIEVGESWVSHTQSLDIGRIHAPDLKAVEKWIRATETKVVTSASPHVFRLQRGLCCPNRSFIAADGCNTCHSVARAVGTAQATLGSSQYSLINSNHSNE